MSPDMMANNWISAGVNAPVMVAQSLILISS